MAKYSIQNKVAEAYDDLIKNANFEHIIISYSTQSLLSVEELVDIIKKYASGEVTIKYYPFREYKNIRSSQKGDNLQEVLIYFHKKQRKCVDYIKSPLNYSGSKNYIVDQIIEQLPASFDVFVDAMGGAFNVGVNVSEANTVIYNEYNEELTKEYETQKAALEKAVKEKAYKTGKATKMRAYLEAMKQADDFLEEWSDEAWILMVETATVNRDKTITFKFTNGKMIIAKPIIYILFRTELVFGSFCTS
mgnify:CR=1 FL=1